MHVWNLWNSLTPDQKLKALEPAAIVLAALIAAGGVVYEIGKSRGREILFRLHEQRKEKYADLLRILIPLISRAGEMNEKIAAGMPADEALKAVGFDREQWLSAHISLSLYGSEEVVRRYLAWQQSAAAGNPTLFSQCMADLLRQMRRDVGLGRTRLNRREMLSMFMTDVDQALSPGEHR